ncbi:hypothetical protein BU16DRAFT_530484 [Lophium mytilinum]|uniref:Uncharacterized protein n=1 Tax=Lophium mytilinum TaxID=390894 RepID=A0A6A6QGY5_9PEZI|nr:hypothetical protein BU16DRAFT_530484 [Lophium mytilinum]
MKTVSQFRPNPSISAYGPGDSWLSLLGAQKSSIAKLTTKEKPRAVTAKASQVLEDSWSVVFLNGLPEVTKPVAKKLGAVLNRSRVFDLVDQMESKVGKQDCDDFIKSSFDSYKPAEPPKKASEPPQSVFRPPKRWVIYTSCLEKNPDDTAIFLRIVELARKKNRRVFCINLNLSPKIPKGKKSENTSPRRASRDLIAKSRLITPSEMELKDTEIFLNLDTTSCTPESVKILLIRVMALVHRANEAVIVIGDQPEDEQLKDVVEMLGRLTKRGLFLFNGNGLRQFPLGNPSTKLMIDELNGFLNGLKGQPLSVVASLIESFSSKDPKAAKDSETITDPKVDKDSKTVKDSKASTNLEAKHGTETAGA